MCKRSQERDHIVMFKHSEIEATFSLPPKVDHYFCCTEFSVARDILFSMEDEIPA